MITIVCIRDVRTHREKTCIITRIHFKLFCEQAFLHDVYHCDLNGILAIPVTMRVRKQVQGVSDSINKQ